MNISFVTNEEGIEKLKRFVKTRDEMGGSLYFNVMEDQCLELADNLLAAGVDKQQLADIGGWETK